VTLEPHTAEYVRPLPDLRATPACGRINSLRKDAFGPASHYYINKINQIYSPHTS